MKVGLRRGATAISGDLQPDGAIAVFDSLLTNDDACRIQTDLPASRTGRSRERPKQGHEPSQAAAASPQAGDDRRSDQRGEAAGGALRQLSARAAPLSQSRDFEPAQA